MKRKNSLAHVLDIPTLFYPKEIGKSLVEVEIDIIETSKQKVLSRWYHSDNDADLFLWSDENNNIIKQQVIFCGQVAEWNIIDGLKTGFMLENEEDLNYANRNDEDIIEITKANNKKVKYDNTPHKVALHQASQIVSSIEDMTDHIRKQLKGNFEFGKRLIDMSNQEIVSQFGEHLNKNKSWQRELIKKIKSWF